MESAASAIAKYLIDQGILDDRSALEGAPGSDLHVCYLEPLEGLPEPAKVQEDTDADVFSTVGIWTNGGFPSGFYSQHMDVPLIRFNIRESQELAAPSGLEIANDILEALGIGNINRTGYTDIGGLQIGWIELLDPPARANELYPSGGYSYTFSIRCRVHRADYAF